MNATMMQFIYESASPTVQVAAGTLTGFLVIFLFLMALISALSNRNTN